MHTTSDNQQAMRQTRGFFFITVGIVVFALILFTLFRVWGYSSRSPKISPVAIAAQSKPLINPLEKVPYTVEPAPGCGPKCEWRDTSDNLYTLVSAEGETVVRVMINDHYTGYWMILDASRPNNPVTDCSTLEQAKYWSEKNSDIIIKRRLR